MGTDCSGGRMERMLRVGSPGIIAVIQERRFKGLNKRSSIKGGKEEFDLRNILDAVFRCGG